MRLKKTSAPRPLTLKLDVKVEVVMLNKIVSLPLPCQRQENAINSFLQH